MYSQSRPARGSVARFVDEIAEIHVGEITEFVGSAGFLPDFFGSGYMQPQETKSAEAFSWELYRRNREYKALIGTIAALAVVWLRMWLLRRYGY